MKKVLELNPIWQKRRYALSMFIIVVLSFLSHWKGSPQSQFLINCGGILVFYGYRKLTQKNSFWEGLFLTGMLLAIILVPVGTLLSIYLFGFSLPQAFTFGVTLVWAVPFFSIVLNEQSSSKD